MRSIGLVSLLLLAYPIQVFGHGISFDSTSPKPYQDMDVALFIKVEPPVVTELLERGRITITVKDTSSNRIIEDVALLIRIVKDDRVLLEDMFNSPDGRIVMNIIPKDVKPKISAFWDPRDGWRASKDLPATIEAPILLEGGLYHFIIEVHKLDGNEIPENMILEYDTFISIGQAYEFDVDDNKITIWSLYDKIIDFKYDGMIRFATPLDWSKEYISSLSLMHIDVIIPRELINANNYDVRLNGISISRDALRIDTSKEDVVAVHIILLNKHLDIISNLMDKAYEEKGIAEFMLMPLVKSSSNVDMLIDTSSKGNYEVSLRYSPSLLTDIPVTFIIGFKDLRSNAVSDAKFDFVIIKDGDVVFREDDLTTLVGVGTIQYTFTDVGSYTIRLEDINDEQEDVEFNIRVIPEFPIAIIVASIGVSMSILFARRL